MNKLFRTINKIKMVKYTIPKIVSNHENFLVKGNYLIDPTLAYIYLKNKNLEFIKNSWDYRYLSKYNIYFRNMIIKFFGKKIEVMSNNNEFMGNILKINRVKSNIKIYDVENEKILTLFKSKKDMIKEIESRKKYGEYFNIPYYELKKDKGYIIEDLLTNIKIDINKKYDYILKDYMDYFSEISKKEYDYLDIKDLFSKYKNTVLSKVIDKYKEKEKCKIPKVFMHGDCSDVNTIYNKNIYYIDFEESKINYFLYDFFRFQLNQLFYTGDEQLIKNYFKGNYDKYLTKYFNSFNLEFSKKDKDFYFFIFILKYIIELEIFNYIEKNNSKNNEINKIKDLIKKYILK